MNDLAQAYGDAFYFLMIVCIISVPLGFWKLAEIIIWAVKHIVIVIK